MAIAAVCLSPANAQPAERPPSVERAPDAAQPTIRLKKHAQKHRGAARFANAVTFHDLIQRHASDNNVPFALADAVVRLESGYNPGIVHAGNYGLMQITLGSARSLGFKGPPSGLLDPDTNLTYGMKYLGAAYQLAKSDTCRTIMRYQSGLGATKLSPANLAYCARVLKLAA